MPDAPDPSLKIRTLRDLVAAVPLFVGYQPRESLVVVSLRGPGRRLGATMCVPLPEEQHELLLAESLAVPARNAGATACLLLVYTEQPGEAPGCSAVEAVRDALDATGIDVREAVLVRSGRWRSYDCDDWSCCPPGGSAVPPVDGALAAMTVVSGRAVLPDRSALVRSVAPVCGPRARRMTLHLQQARRTAGGATAASVLDIARRCIDDNAAGRVVSTRDVARVIVGCDDVLVRDALLAGMAGEDPQALLAFLVHAVRLAVPPYDAHVAAALAWVAYSGGNGGLANVALDRALATDPAHGMARLVRSAIDHGLPPEELRRVCAATADELSTRLDLDDRPCA